MKKIKLISPDAGHGPSKWLWQMPGGKPVWGDCQFSFDVFDEDYDWLVMIDKFPRSLGGSALISCPPERTIFVATEPSSITYYGGGFVKQFGYLITNQPETVLPHPNARRTQPGNHWFYRKPFDQILSEKPHQKTGLFSVIATHRMDKHTLHQLRFEFIKKVVDEIPDADLLFSYKHIEKEMRDIYGDSIKYVSGKHDMVDDYKYHLVVGNEVGPDILTERISDAFLGYSVPVSFGCTNLADYFPEDSFIEIDIYKPDDAIEKIKTIIYDEDDYARRLDSVIEARRLVIEKYNLIPMIVNIVDNHQSLSREHAKNTKIYNRRVCRFLHLKDLLGFIAFKFRHFFADLA